MTRLSTAIGLAAILVASVPAPGLAGGHRGPRDAVVTFGPPLRRPAYNGPSINGLPGPSPFVGSPFAHRSPVQRPFGRRPFARHAAPFPIVSSPVIVYSTPAPVPAPPPTYYAPPIAAPAPILSRVVEYTTGRYELRGDGVWTPYQWVWIPAPPPSPPPPAEVPDEAPAPPPRSAPAAATPAPRSEARRDIYRWTDEQGVTTWTDQWDKIPPEYRDRAQRMGVPSS
jgi:hypothetical protein